MKLEDATAIKVGSASASSVYVGSTLVWPSNYSYIILNATVNYSSGSTLNAGVVGSNYSGNYAYVTGTVRIQRGQVVISETTEYLVPTISNTSDFNVIYDSTLGYYIIRGNNLGTIPTSTIKSSSVSATYSSSSAYTGLTVTQEANVIESYTYNLSVDIDVSGTISYLGGILDVDYVSKRTPVYSSGASGSEVDYTASVSASNCTPDVATVTGTGTFSITVAENTSTSLQQTIGVTISGDGHSASDTATQDAAPVVVTPHANVYPDLDTNGRARLRFVLTQGTVTFPVVISGLVYHYAIDGGSSGDDALSGDYTVQSDGAAINLPAMHTYFSGMSGTHYFSASSVSQVGIANTTFTQTSFAVM